VKFLGFVDFINGIILKANNALARFQRDSLLKEEENIKVEHH